MAYLGFLTIFRKPLGGIPPWCCIPLTIFMLSGCTSSTTFRILDAETKKPVEGAVALAEWTKDYGLPGLSVVKSAKLVEAISDSNGFLTIPGAVGTLALQTPLIQIYKAGYVGWNSTRIYLGYRGSDIKRLRAKKREGFTMKDQNIFLEPWKDEYSYISHGSFISTGADFGKEIGLTSFDSKYRKAIDYEIQFRIDERNTLSD